MSRERPVDRRPPPPPPVNCGSVHDESSGKPLAASSPAVNDQTPVACLGSVVLLATSSRSTSGSVRISVSSRCSR